MTLDNAEAGVGSGAPSEPLWADPDEIGRLTALRDYAILDTPREDIFDDFVRLAAEICDAPMAAISLVDADRQWFKAELGLGVRETPRELAICAHAIRQTGLFVVPDTSRDSRFSDNPLVTGDPGLRFYGGAPLQTGEGLSLGTLCVLDHKPRPQGLTERQQFSLRMLARQVMAQLDLRRALVDRRRAEAALRAAHARTTEILSSISDIFYVLDRDWHVTYANDRTLATWGLDAAAAIGRDLRTMFPHVDFLASDAFAAYQEVMTARQPLRRIFRSAIADRWFDASVVPMSDGGLSANLRDVTELVRIDEALKTAATEKDLLILEVHHRVKNSLQMVQNLLNMQARAADPQTAQLLRESSSRVLTIAAIHDRLYRDGLALKVEIAPYLQGLIDDLSQATAAGLAGRAIVLDCDAAVWDAADVPTLGLVATELVTNALKYGDGIVGVAFRQPASAQATLTVEDQGTALPADFSPDGRSGLGMRLVTGLLRVRDGRLDVHRDRGHTCFVATLPRSSGAKIELPAEKR